MSRRLPPLNALRAFEAAARHLSFTEAARELNVTQAAVSHQIRGLEARLGQSLFHRRNRGLTLTEAGRSYLPALTEAFDLMDKATRRLSLREEEGSLKVSALPSFAARWLLPRLARFREQHPDIDVLVSANQELSDLEAEGIDVGLRFGSGRYPGLTVERLMGDRRLPVCSPALLQGPKPLGKPEDLRHHVLLHDEVFGGGIEADWQTWVRLVGLKGIDPQRGPGFSDSAMVLSAAIAGQGVALARASLAVDDLAAGLLTLPFGPSVRTRYDYWFVTTPRAAAQAKVKVFRAWMMAEAADTEARIEALAAEQGDAQVDD
ncbi:transcriptional regulator GcvA [Aquibaculum sediminis]|uniref:transcriptional regulator GcvA n=1 Tax=Aquibaculum sediminis TaxID=3231907 RepID=UPI003452C6F8